MDMSEIVNVINLEKRTDRMDSFKRQSEEQGFEFKRWQGIEDAIVFRGISASHKAIVKHAKATKQRICCIAEDDCIFLGKGSWDYFLSQMPEDFSLYLSMVYEGEIDGSNRLKKSAKTFSGLTCYFLHESFYDIFLNMNPMAHLDRELGKYADKYKYIVCDKFVCKQSNGYSDQKKRYCYYDRYLKGRKMYEG